MCSQGALHCTAAISHLSPCFSTLQRSLHFQRLRRARSEYRWSLARASFTEFRDADGVHGCYLVGVGDLYKGGVRGGGERVGWVAASWYV